jgi:hypothetical protein
MASLSVGSSPLDYLTSHFPAGPIGPFGIPWERAYAFLLQVDGLPFTAQEKADLFSAPFVGYLVDRSHRPGCHGKTISVDVWRNRCRLLRIPTIIAFPYRKIAPIHMSLESAQRNIADDYTQVLYSELERFELMHPHKNIRQNCLVSARVREKDIPDVAGVLTDAVLNNSISWYEQIKNVTT